MTMPNVKECMRYTMPCRFLLDYYFHNDYSKMAIVKEYQSHIEQKIIIIYNIVVYSMGLVAFHKTRCLILFVNHKIIMFRPPTPLRITGRPLKIFRNIQTTIQLVACHQQIVETWLPFIPDQCQCYCGFKIDACCILVFTYVKKSVPWFCLLIICVNKSWSFANYS